MKEQKQLAPLDRTRLKTYTLRERKSKVSVEGFARPHLPGASFKEFVEFLPKFLGAKDLLEVADHIVEARTEGRMVLLGIGGHVLKVGLSPIIADLMREGWIWAIATNGAGMIHDFEIALVGHTSEDVDQALVDGSFGMAYETGDLLNKMINEGVGTGVGLGEAVGRSILELPAQHSHKSILATGVSLGRPVTVHVALGTDVNHLHPRADATKIGEGTYKDFLRFCERVASLEGGVYLNVGSAVLLPEIFVKALSLARNLGQPLKEIITVNMDFIQHYRPMVNVVRRPTSLGGKGYALTGHHELMIPLLAAIVKEKAAASRAVPLPCRAP